MRKFLLSALLSTTFYMTPARAVDVVPDKADIVVHARPPHAVKEERPATPGPDYLWIEGYQQWNGAAYAWQAGHWEKPPHEHAIWMAPHWQRRDHEYVFVQGWWE